MRPFKLHVKTTLLVSAAVVAIFSIVAFFYNEATRELERQQLIEQSKQLALFRAFQYAERFSEGGMPTTRQSAEEVVEKMRQGPSRASIAELVYFNGPRGPGDPIVVAAPADKAQSLSSAAIMLLLQGEPVADQEGTGDNRTAWAAAPVVVTGPLPIGKMPIGAVYVQVEVPHETLADQLNRLTVASMALVVIVVALATYWLFRRLVYKPIDALLVAMARAESGDLSVHVPPRAHDEVGLLTVSFNRMVDRLHELADERAAHARQLEGRIQEATQKLAERNQQLAEANIQLFEIQRQLGQLERLATAGQLAAQFAHEVGTPLNLISGHVQLLRARATDDRAIKRLEIIAAQIMRIERIVRNMLDQTRRPSVRFEQVDVGALIARIADTIAPTLAAHRVELEVRIEHGLLPIEGDGDQLQQVFINLVNNSLDAMPGGGRLTVEATRRDDRIYVSLSDTGHGISEADLPRIFDPLFTTKDRGRGSGLGLAVSVEIVREHGGRMEVSSSPEAGATFTIILPVAPTESGAEVEPESLTAGEKAL